MSFQYSLFGQGIKTDENGRRDNDFYPTAQGVTLSLLRRVPTICGLVAEPCAGRGDMARVLAAEGKYMSPNGPGLRVVTNDIDPFWPCDYTSDARDPRVGIWQHTYDWVVTNPPYGMALPILKTAWQRATKGVAFLLRLSFVEPTQAGPDARARWLSEHRQCHSHLLPLNPRPSFTEDGSTDSVTVAWFVWQKNWHGWGTTIDYITDWKELT